MQRVSTRRGSDMRLRGYVLCGILVAVAGAGLWLWRHATTGPMDAFRTFPYTYITAAAAGYDPAAVVIDRGQIDGPPSVQVEPGGAIAWPAFIDPGGRIVPAKDGRPYIFPVITDGTASRTPVLAPIGRALRGPEIDAMVRYQTAEGAERLAAFRREMQ